MDTKESMLALHGTHVKETVYLCEKLNTIFSSIEESRETLSLWFAPRTVESLIKKLVMLEYNYDYECHRSRFAESTGYIQAYRVNEFYVYPDGSIKRNSESGLI